MLDIMYEIPSKENVKEVIITKEVVTGSAEPQMVMYEEGEKERVSKPTGPAEESA